jgi:hypothetical protein
MDDELITVHFVWTAAATQESWTPEVDYFVKFITSAGQCAVEYTNVSFASLITPSQARRDLLYLQNNTAGNSAGPQSVIDRTIYANETLYVAHPAAVGFLTLFLLSLPRKA